MDPSSRGAVPAVDTGFTSGRSPGIVVGGTNHNVFTIRRHRDGLTKKVVVSVSVNVSAKLVPVRTDVVPLEDAHVSPIGASNAVVCWSADRKTGAVGRNPESKTCPVTLRLSDNLTSDLDPVGSGQVPVQYSHEAVPGSTAIGLRRPNGNPVAITRHRNRPAEPVRQSPALDVPTDLNPVVPVVLEHPHMAGAVRRTVVVRGSDSDAIPVLGNRDSCARLVSPCNPVDVGPELTPRQKGGVPFENARMAGRTPYRVVRRRADNNPSAIFRNRNRGTRSVSLGLAFEVLTNLIPNYGAGGLSRLRPEHRNQTRERCCKENQGPNGERPVPAGNAAPAQRPVTGQRNAKICG